jgi:DNA-binding response OmpR family regulator
MGNNKNRILIIEDEQDLAEALQMRLQDKNYEVTLAADGSEGLKKAHAEKPDLIILDIRLPKLDGFKLCRMLKFDEEYKNIFIVILTAKVQPADLQTGKEVGADAYLTKPYRSEELLETIERILGKEGC